jgi:ankyrin repeat protein
MENQQSINRSAFLKTSLLTIAGLSIPLWSKSKPVVQDKPAPLKPEVVKEFVTVAHGNFARMKEMLENDHLLLHAANDWGGGDFESAIEAAGHMGNKEIANYLLGKGARYNIYLACMMGHIDIVKQVLTMNPGLLNSKGPHGFTMLHHAQKGGAEAVAGYLQSLGAKETKVDFYAKL